MPLAPFLRRAGLAAAGINGIPAASLLDAEGRIALIDLPGCYDEALVQLLAGKLGFQKQPSLVLGL